jgi:hypothetical protein
MNNNLTEIPNINPKMLKVGGKYKATPLFADAWGTPYVNGKEVVYEGIVSKGRHNQRDGDYQEEVHSFTVLETGENLTCSKNMSPEEILKMLAE